MLPLAGLAPQLAKWAPSVATAASDVDTLDASAPEPLSLAADATVV